MRAIIYHSKRIAEWHARIYDRIDSRRDGVEAWYAIAAWYDMESLL